MTHTYPHPQQRLYLYHYCILKDFHSIYVNFVLIQSVFAILVGKLKPLQGFSIDLFDALPFLFCELVIQ